MAGLLLDHPYIDAHNVAERFVRGELPKYERESFERHYVECAECMDRVALAQIFHVENAKPKVIPKRKRPEGIFNVLGTFTPGQQAAIFAASTLALLLMPIVTLTLLDANKTKSLAAESEPIVWMQPAGAVEARVPGGAERFALATKCPDEPGIYRLSIVDISDRVLMSGADQIQSQGVSLGLSISSLPHGVTLAAIERKAPNGAYIMVARHALLIEWR